MPHLSRPRDETHCSSRRVSVGLGPQPFSAHDPAADHSFSSACPHTAGIRKRDDPDQEPAMRNQAPEQRNDSAFELQRIPRRRGTIRTQRRQCEPQTRAKTERRTFGVSDADRRGALTPSNQPSRHRASTPHCRRSVLDAVNQRSRSCMAVGDPKVLALSLLEFGVATVPLGPYCSRRRGLPRSSKGAVFRWFWQPGFSSPASWSGSSRYVCRPCAGMHRERNE